MPPILTFPVLARALGQFGQNKYSGIDVFADDVRELVDARRSGQVPAGATPLDLTGTRFRVVVGGQAHLLRIFPAQGIARFSRPEGVADQVVAGAAVGATLGAAIGSAHDKKGDGLLGGLILGLLAGGALGSLAAGSRSQSQRVLTLAFDPTAQQWRVYDGGLVRWVKTNLAVG